MKRVHYFISWFSNVFFSPFFSLTAPKAKESEAGSSICFFLSRSSTPMCGRSVLAICLTISCPAASPSHAQQAAHPEAQIEPEDSSFVQFKNSEYFSLIQNPNSKNVKTVHYFFTPLKKLVNILHAGIFFTLIPYSLINYSNLTHFGDIFIEIFTNFRVSREISLFFSELGISGNVSLFFKVDLGISEKRSLLF